MVGCGIPEGEIAKLIANPQTNRPIDEKTLRLHFRSEIDRGQVKANTAVAQSIYRAALSGNMTAAIFWAKTRMGWKETTVLEHDITGRLAESLEAARKRIHGAR
jgi:hypothetical protein